MSCTVEGVCVVLLELQDTVVISVSALSALASCKLTQRLRHLIASVHGLVSARCYIQTQPSSPTFTPPLPFVTKKKDNNSIQSTFSVNFFQLLLLGCLRIRCLS